MKTLVIIPARGGSKGIPLKNIKLLNGVPLIYYTIDVARTFAEDSDICVSTDSEEIIGIVSQKGLSVPFLRPPELATDSAGSYEVLLHALAFYRAKGIEYERILLLQPTSPFRLPKHLNDISQMYSNDIEMVVSVGLSPYNPYFSVFEENRSGYLTKSKEGSFRRRQDVPPAYFYNGSLYMINVSALLSKPIGEFVKVKKYLMEELYCQDIDTPLDWLVCEAILQQGLFHPTVTSVGPRS